MHYGFTQSQHRQASSFTEQSTLIKPDHQIFLSEVAELFKLFKMCVFKLYQFISCKKQRFLFLCFCRTSCPYHKLSRLQACSWWGNSSRTSHLANPTKPNANNNLAIQDLVLCIIKHSVILWIFVLSLCHGKIASLIVYEIQAWVHQHSVNYIYCLVDPEADGMTHIQNIWK